MSSKLYCGNSEVIQGGESAGNLLNSDVKLFKIVLSDYYKVIDALSKSLTIAERERAERYRQTKDKNRFIISRSLLKHLLAEESGVDIAKITLEKHTNHKPYLPSDKSLHFNVSHAGDIALIAISKYEIGVDIEFIDNEFNYTEILPTVFSKEEMKLIHESKNKRHSFYKFWTRKEAIVKAIGRGIDDALIKIPVINQLHTVPLNLMAGYDIVRVLSFDISENYVASLAVCAPIYDFHNLHIHEAPVAEEFLV